jgi:hypothetical protein
MGVGVGVDVAGVVGGGVVVLVVVLVAGVRDGPVVPAAFGLPFDPTAIRTIAVTRPRTASAPAPARPTEK